MKRTIEVLVMLLLTAATPFALAQRGGSGVHAQHDRSKVISQSTPMMQVTDDQRTALAKCMEATERVRQAVRQMTKKHSPYSRSHMIYNLNTVSEQTGQFEAALTDLTTAHQEFRNTLDEAQDSRLEKRLRKLDHLQAELNSRVTKIDYGLAAERLDSLDISRNVDMVVRAANGWRSEHRKIAKEMGIPK